MLYQFVQFFIGTLCSEPNNHIATHFMKCTVWNSVSAAINYAWVMVILNLLPFIVILTSGNESNHEAAILTGEKKK